MRASATGITPGSRSGHPSACRCLPCRPARSAYEREREEVVKEVGPAIVTDEKARERLKRLASRHNVGLRAVSAATDITVKALRDIRSGKQTTIRRKTEERILSVNRLAVSDHALVPAATTWRQINELLEEGYTQQLLAERLGINSGVIEFNEKQVWAATATKVDKLYRKCMF